MDKLIIRGARVLIVVSGLSGSGKSSPAIFIEQKTTHRNPRSTVGTVTEIYDYYRLLYARIGVPHCPDCGISIPELQPRLFSFNVFSQAGKGGQLARPVQPGSLVPVSPSQVSSSESVPSTVWVPPILRALPRL
jgi:hypothetical protein